MKRTILVVMVLSVFLSQAKSQGCSDAGFCTIHSFKDNTVKKALSVEKQNEIVVGFAFGKGERSVSYYTPYIEYTRSISERSSITAKFIASAITGELAKTFGPGDLFLSFNHSIHTGSKWRQSFVAGFKLPFDKADIVKEGIHLPMPYQTSLGTTDLVLGINAASGNFGMTFALQQPLSRTNGNQFLPELYPGQPLANRYLPTNDFERKGDLLLRLSYNFDLSKKISLRPSLLSIYHLANDRYLDAAKVRREIELSRGLTLNGNLFIDYHLPNNDQFELSIGSPFVVRNNRPDGLTRSLVASVEYKFGF